MRRRDYVLNEKKLVLLEGDITKVAADAIVNAANSRLAGGGGVDGAIHRVGGPSIMRELDEIRAKIGRCETGDAVMTGAGDLPAQCVIHAVGPVYRDGNQGEPEQLESCYRKALQIAADQGAVSVTLPSISTGVYGYPVAAAARIALRTVASEIADSPVEQATFVLFGKDAFEAHVKVADEEFGSPKSRGAAV